MSTADQAQWTQMQADMEKHGPSVVVGGEQISMGKLRWFMDAPCGCMSAVMVTNPGGRWLLDEGDAWLQFYMDDDPRLIDQDRALGFRIYLAPTQRIERLTGKCPHLPRYGVPLDPTFPGFAWAGPRMGRKTALAHLVDEAAVKAKDENWREPAAKSLCGRSMDRGVTTDHWGVDGRVKCGKCKAKAAAS